MALSWNEIKTRAAAFVHEWKGETQERAEAQSFWNAFLHVFGVHRRLDRAVDRAYRPQRFTTETNRVGFLFDRYEALTNALFSGG